MLKLCWFMMAFAVQQCIAPQAVNDDIGTFWQLTDVHLDLDYDAHNCSGRLGDYECDSPLELVRSAFQKAKDTTPYGKPDFVVYSGDSGSHFERSSGEFMANMKEVATLLRTMFNPLDVPVVPSLGNHDVHPENIMPIDDVTGERTKYCHKLASDDELWGTWIKSADQSISAASMNIPVANFSNGCFFSRLIEVPPSADPQEPRRRLLIISLNGLLWYIGNKQSNSTAADPLHQLDWLSRSLDWARSADAKVVIVCHFPAGAAENAPRIYKSFHPIINEEIVRLLRKHADIIMIAMFAHQHTDSFRVLRDSGGNAVLPLFHGPSVSPFHLRGLGSFNPRIRMYQYSRSKLHLVDYHQWYLNLSDTNPSWQVHYQATAAYNLPDLSAKSLDGLLQDFLDSDDAAGRWSSYWDHEMGERPHDRSTCKNRTEPCRCYHVCAMRNIDFTNLDSCLDQCDAGGAIYKSSFASSIASNTIPLVAGVILTFLIILFGVVIYANRETCRHRQHYFASGFGGRGNRELISINRHGFAGYTLDNVAIGDVSAGDSPPLIPYNSQLKSVALAGDDYVTTRDTLPLHEDGQLCHSDLRDNCLRSSLRVLPHFGSPRRVHTDRRNTKPEIVPYEKDFLRPSYPPASVETLRSSAGNLTVTGISEAQTDSLVTHPTDPDYNSSQCANAQLEETAYDAEVEDDDDDYDSSVRRGASNGARRLPSATSSRQPSRREEGAPEISDADYYSIHDSLPGLDQRLEKSADHEGPSSSRMYQSYSSTAGFMASVLLEAPESIGTTVDDSRAVTGVGVPRLLPEVPIYPARSHTTADLSGSADVLSPFRPDDIDVPPSWQNLRASYEYVRI